MIYLIVILIMLVAFAAVYGFLYQSGLLESPGQRAASGSGRAEPFRVPGLGELPQGCLMAIVVAAFVWFVTWGIVLILALRFLRSPLGD